MRLELMFKGEFFKNVPSKNNNNNIVFYTTVLLIMNFFYGRFTKFYPKFHYLREFLTFTNIILIWFSLLVWISHFSCADARISHFLVWISHFWPLFPWNSHFSIEFLTLPAGHTRTPAGPIARRPALFVSPASPLPRRPSQWHHG